MHRDMARLASEEFDVIVAGGGVYALTLAAELASRGLRLAILERRDFAGATSFNSLKTIHGGIRALQHGAIADMREFVRERRAFARLAPHLVRPLAFVVPTYRHPVRNRPAMAAFLAVYDRLAADRNDGVDASLRLPRSRTVDRAECLRLSPAIDPTGVTGGAVWHDYQLQAPERFALALLHSAREAAAANYAPVTAILHRNGRVTGVRAHDALADVPFEVRGRAVINAAGPWAWDLLARSGLGPAGQPPGFSFAMNVVVGRPPLPQATGGLAAGRFLFMVPWAACSIIGTSHDRHDGGADDLAVSRERVDRFLGAIGAAFPGVGITRDDIRLVHRGLLPAADPTHPDRLLKRSLVWDHARDGVHGLLTVVGVRYTTARATASAVADRVSRVLGSTGTAGTTGTLAGEDIEDLAEYERTETVRTGLPAGLVRRLIGTYGTGYRAIVAAMRAEPRLAAPLAPGCAVLAAEIAHAARHEMAVHLTDALLRRTGAGTGGHPGRDAVARAAAVMAGELSWTPARAAGEIAAVDACYALD